MGDILSRFGSIGRIQSTLTSGAIGAVLDGLMATLTLAMMITYSGRLALLVVGAVIAYTTVRLVSYGPLREARKEALLLSAREQSCFQETLRAIQAIKLCGGELARRGRWLSAMVDAVNRGVRTQKFSLWFGIANTAIGSFQSLLVFWYGAHLVLDGVYTIGMLFAFNAYAGQFGARMTSLIDKAIEFRMLNMQCERLADILLEPTEEDGQDSSAEQLEPVLTLSGVGFRYGEREPWILQHVSLTIPAGQSVAVVGPSGCGKTTLIKLILGLLTPTEGQILYGGVPLERLKRDSYRRVVAAVMQSDQMLAGSIAENISFFAHGAAPDRIAACARMAAVHDDIQAMPMGYHTLVGDMGSTLSGGQKQRVLLARALYREPRLLVLDEATSHLDVERERRVNDAVSKLPITRICVAHRPETIAMAGRVIRLDRGTVSQDLQLASTNDRVG